MATHVKVKSDTVNVELLACRYFGDFVIISLFLIWQLHALSQTRCAYAPKYWRFLIWRTLYLMAKLNVPSIFLRLQYITQGKEPWSFNSRSHLHLCTYTHAGDVK